MERRLSKSALERIYEPSARVPQCAIPYSLLPATAQLHTRPELQVLSTVHAKTF